MFSLDSPYSQVQEIYESGRTPMSLAACHKHAPLLPPLDSEIYVKVMAIIKFAWMRGVFGRRRRSISVNGDARALPPGIGVWNGP